MNFDEHLNSNELERLNQKPNSTNIEQGYKCGEAFFFSSTGNIIVHCTLCDANFDYATENYLKHIISNHFVKSLSNTKKNEFSSITEIHLKREISTEDDKDNIEKKILKIPHSHAKLNKKKAKEEMKISNKKLNDRRKKYKFSNTVVNTENIQKKDTNQCLNCFEEFTKKSDLIAHKKTHANYIKILKEGVICEQCGRKFVNKKTLESHYDIAHNPNRRLYPCGDCDKSFANSESLLAHNRHYHTKELPFVCEIENCNKRYASQKGLKYHQGKHSNKVFPCTECNKQYSHKNKLQTHYKRHHAVGKIYHCGQCDKSFYDQYFLKKHMICHTNERPFLCDQCPANFPRQKALVAHKKIHSGIRDEICKLCSQAFNLYEGLYQHMKIRHGIKYYRGMTLEEMTKRNKQNISP